jgi:hypothetical protein
MDLSRWARESGSLRHIVETGGEGVGVKMECREEKRY